MIVNRIARNLGLNSRAPFRSELEQVIRLIAVKRSMVVEKRPEPGDRVRVCEGVFRDVEGTVLERGPQSRLVVAVHLLQQGVTLEIDEKSLEIVA